MSDRFRLQMDVSYAELPVDDEDRMADIPVDEIVKVAAGGVYRMTNPLEFQAYLTVEFLGDAKIEQLAPVNGHKIGDTVNWFPTLRSMSLV